MASLPVSRPPTTEPLVSAAPGHPSAASTVVNKRLLPYLQLEYQIQSHVDERLRKAFLAAETQLHQELDKGKFHLDERFMPQRVEKYNPEAHVVGPYAAGIAHYIGRRPKMLDRHLAQAFAVTINKCEYPAQLFGIFDGHGKTADAADYAKDHLIRHITHRLQVHNPDGLTDEGTWHAMKLACVDLNEEFKRTHPEQSGSGTTAIFSMVLGDNLWTVTVGDSRAFLIKGGSLSPKTPMFNITVGSTQHKVSFLLEATDRQDQAEDQTNLLKQELISKLQALPSPSDENVINALTQVYNSVKCSFFISFSRQIWRVSRNDGVPVVSQYGSIPVRLSEDARTHHPRFKKSIENRGMRILEGRIEGDLAPARAIGNANLRFVSARPKIVKLPLAKLPPDFVLVIISDGIVEMMSSWELAVLLRRNRQQAEVDALASTCVALALRSGSKDNLTALVVKKLPGVVQKSGNAREAT